MSNSTSTTISESTLVSQGALEALSSSSCTVVCGSRKILAIKEKIRALRVWTGQQRDVTTDPDWFVKMAMARCCRPWVVLLSEHGRLVAAMVFAEKCVSGIPTGYVKAEGMDEGFLICQPDLRTFYFPLLLNGLFAKRSALIAQVSQLANSETACLPPADSAGVDVHWKRALYHYRLRLMRTMEETLASYGSHTRRNLRYYLRKARAEGYRFVAALTQVECLDAVSSLRGHATHEVSTKSTWLREEVNRSTPTSFSMGVQAVDGSWVSYLTGWRSGKQTFVSWQMNRVIDRSSSIGTAIRSFMMEEEIARGATEIIFLGGSSEVFKRCCEEDPSVHLIVRRRGLRGWALSKLLGRVVVPGHPLRAS